MAKVGAHLKLTPRTMAAICDAIQIGTPLRHAAVYGGVSYRTFLYWMQQGQEEADRLEALVEAGEENPAVLPEKERYLQLLRKVEEAKANAAVGWTNTINQAANTSPEWARYMLSKWTPELHGDQAQRIELTGKDGGAIKTDATITDERRVTELMALLDRARERSGGAADSGTGDATELTD